MHLLYIFKELLRRFLGFAAREAYNTHIELPRNHNMKKS